MVYTSEQIMDAIKGLKKELSQRRSIEDMLQEFQHISVNQARKIFNTTHQGIYKMVNDGQLNATSVNGVPKILVKSIIDYIDRHPHRFAQAENRSGKVFIPEDSSYSRFIAEVKANQQKHKSKKGSRNEKDR